jgi:hypothetical protein
VIITGMKLHRRSYEEKQKRMAYILFQRREADNRVTHFKAIAGYYFYLGATIAAIVIMLILIATNGR